MCLVSQEGCQLLKMHVCNMMELPSASHFQWVTWRQIVKETLDPYPETIKYQTWALGDVSGFLFSDSNCDLHQWKKKKSPNLFYTRGFGFRHSALGLGSVLGTGCASQYWEACVCSEMSFPIWSQEVQAANVVQRRKKCSDKWGKHGGLCGREKMTITVKVEKICTSMT